MTVGDVNYLAEMKLWKVERSTSQYMWNNLVANFAVIYVGSAMYLPYIGLSYTLWYQLLISLSQSYHPIFSQNAYPHPTKRYQRRRCGPSQFANGECSRPESWFRFGSISERWSVNDGNCSNWYRNCRASQCKFLKAGDVFLFIRCHIQYQQCLTYF